MSNSERTRRPLFLNPSSPNVTQIDPETTALLLAIGRGEVEVNRPSLPRVVGGWWHDVDLTGRSSSWLWDKDSLSLVIESPFDDLDLTRRHGAMNRQVRVALETGDSFEAQFGHMLSHSGHIDFSAGTATRTHTVELDVWVWKPHAPHRYWLAPIEVSFDDGNLVLQDQTWADSRNLRLRGANVLYLVRTRSGAHVLVVDTEGREFDHDTLATDFTALEFVLGQPIALSHLVAVDSNGCTVGAAGGLPEPIHGSSSRCPVAGRRDLYVLKEQDVEEYLWVPILFEHVAARLHADGQDSALLIPISAYLDSLAGRIHTSYLTAQVALEAFATTLSQPTQNVLVKDSRAWERFVEEHRELLSAHAVDEEAGKRLVAKVKNAQQGSSTRRVNDALASLSLDVPESVLTEIARRNSVAHRYLMVAKESTANFQELADRLATIQTLLVALIAKSVGYAGPIVGWEWLRGRRRVPSWWPWVPSAAAKHRFTAIEPTVLSEDDSLGADTPQVTPSNKA